MNVAVYKVCYYLCHSICGVPICVSQYISRAIMCVIVHKVNHNLCHSKYGVPLFVPQYRRHETICDTYIRCATICVTV